MSAPSDLNISRSEDEFSFKQQVKMSIRLGYEIIGINNFVEEILPKPGAKKKKEKPPNVEPAEKLLLSSAELKEIQSSSQSAWIKPLEQFSRFTTVLSDPLQSRRIQQDAAIQSHDIIAVQPTSEKLFNMACKEMEIDIICLDLTQRLGFGLKRQAIGVAIERGIHFEIPYCPMIRDSTLRRNVINNAQNLIRVSKAKNIVITSQCEKAMELRGPYDVANLALLFGMTEAQAKAAVGVNARSLLLHAAARKTARGVLSITMTSNLTPSQLWTLREASGIALSKVKDGDVPAVTDGKETVSDNGVSGKHKMNDEDQVEDDSSSPMKKIKTS